MTLIEAIAVGLKVHHKSKGKQFQKGWKGGLTIKSFFQLPGLSLGMLGPRGYNVGKDR